MKIERVRYRIDGVWFDALYPEYKIQDCEAVEMTELMTLDEFKERYSLMHIDRPTATL